MIKHYSLFTEHKKVIIALTISLVVILLLVYSMFVYRDVLKSKTKDYDDVVVTFNEKIPNAEVIDIHRYHGDQLYYVIYAEKDDEKYYYILSPEEGEEWYSFKTTDLHSRQEALNDWKSRCSNCQYINDEVGMDRGYIVLEVNYKNGDGHYVIEHILLEDLTHYKLTLKRSLEQ